MDDRDLIRLTGIEVAARHGVYAAEKLTDQLFVIDVICALARSAQGDDLATTVDYAALAERIAGVVRGESVDLIETLAEQIAFACLDNPLVAVVEVTVHKPQAPMPVRVADVAVTVRRSKDR